MKRRLLLGGVLWSFLTVSVAFSAPKPKANQILEKSDRLAKIGTVYGDGNLIKVDENKQLSTYEMIETYKEDLGLSKQDELKLKKSNEDKIGFTHYRFNQHHNGVKIEAAELIFHEKNGKVKSINGVILEDLNVDTAPSISENQALNFAKSYVGAKSYMWESASGRKLAKMTTGHEDAFDPKGELVILADHLPGFKGAPKLAWKLMIYAEEPQYKADVYVDMKGNIVFENNHILFEKYPCKGIAHNEPDTVQVWADHFQDGFKLDIDDYNNGTPLQTWNANGTQPVDFDQVTSFINSDTLWNDVNPAFDVFAIDIHWGAQQTYDYFWNKFNRNSIDGAGQPMVSYAHVGNQWFNASWNGIYMQFGDGGNGMLTTIAVVSHEFSHGVTSSTSQLIYSKESGALNESFSDIFGTAVEIYTFPDRPKSEIWDIGIRDLSNPKDYDDPDTYQGVNWHDTENNPGDNYGVHTNSGVQNKWFTLLVDGGQGTNDNNDTYDVPMIGVEAAEAIAYRNNTEYLTQTSGYFDARYYSLQATEDLYGAGSDEYNAVAEAWYAVGVGNQLSAKNIGVAAITSPAPSCDLTNAETVTAEVKFFGTDATLPAGTTIDITYNVDGNIANEQIVTQNPVNIGVSFEVQSAATFDFSNPGNHVVNVSVTTAGDNNNLNDSKSENIANTKEGEPNDVELLALVTPIFSCGNFSNAETVTIELRNTGCSTIPSGTSIPVIYSINNDPAIEEVFVLPQDLNFGGVIAYDFAAKADLMMPGSYDFEVNVKYAPDPNNGNNTKMYEVVGGAVVAPVSTDFEGGTGGWTHRALSGTDFWEFGTPNQGQLNAANSGVNAFMTGLNANHPNQSDAVLESPCYDLSGLVTPGFFFSLNFSIEADWDGMIIEYTTDNQTWERLETSGYNNNVSLGGLLSQPWFSGSNGGWTDYAIYLEDLIGETSVRFRFRFASDQAVNDEGAAIDDIMIDEYAGAANDLELVSLLSPYSGCGLTDGEEVKLLIKNNGTNSDLSFQVSYEVNGGGAVIKDVNANIPFEGTYEYTFSNTVDLSMINDYSFDVAIIFPDDEDVANNVLNGVIIQNVEPVTTLPFTEDFESGALPKDWSQIINLDVPDGLIESNGFLYGKVADLSSDGFQIPVLNDDPDNLITTSNDDGCGQTCDKSLDYLVTPFLDFSNLAGVILEFDAYFDIIPGFESSAFIEVQLNNNWEKIFELSASAEWQNIKLDLSNYVGVSCLQIGFHHDDNGNWGTGLAIDNVNISEKATIDLAVVDLIIPATGQCMSDQEEIKIWVENEGIDAVSGFEISYDVEGIIVTQQVNSQIDPGQTVEYTFDLKADLSTPQVYNFIGGVKMVGDEDINNNIFNASTENATINAYPDTEDMEGALTWYNVGGDDLNWTINAFATLSGGTGPSDDHSPIGDNYIYIEASGTDIGFPNKEAVLVSGCFDGLTNLAKPYLEFYYHMLGTTMGSLSVDIYDAETDTWHNDVWMISGNQGDIWHHALIMLEPYGDQVQIRFRGITGNGWSSDIALDDVMVHDKPSTVDIMAYKGPDSGCDMSTVQDVAFQIKNNGTEDLNGFRITYSFNGAPDETEVLNDVILEGEIFTFYPSNINTPLVEGEENTITFTVKKFDDSDDDNVGNETITNHVFVAHPSDIGDLIPKDAYYEWEGEMQGIDAHAVIEPGAGGTSMWSPGEEGVEWNGQYLYATEGGVYTYTYSFENGCEYTDQVEIFFDPKPDLGFSDVEACFEYTIDPTGDFVQYLWSDLTDGSTLTVTESGEYWVTVWDEYGRALTQSLNVTIFAEPAPMAEIANGGDINKCANQASINVNIMGGKAPYTVTYTIDGGNPTDVEMNGSGSIIASQSGLYEITQISSFCQVSVLAGQTINVTLLPPVDQPTVVVDGNTAFCAGSGEQVTMTAPDGFASYSWSTGEETQSITVDAAGSYTVTVSDGQCESTSDAVEVMVYELPATPEISVDGGTEVCAGSSTMLTATDGDFTYEWSNGATTRSIEVSEGGDYTVMVTNANGCKSASSETVSITVDDAAEPVISMSDDALMCEGEANVLTAPEGFEGYEWSNGATEPSITVTETGIYTVTVKSGNCSYTSAEVEIAVSALPEAMITAAENVLTANEGEGYTYAWYKDNVMIDGATDVSYTATESGSYQVMVTNGAGCSATAEATDVKVDPNGVQFVNGIAVMIYPNEVEDIVNVTYGKSQGTLVYQIFDAKGSLVKELSFAGNAKLNLSDLSTGSYTLSIKGDEFNLVERLVKK